jgi:glycerol-3-phosphate O-acyltransferase / dihydroxyacetone phosphate acyltransferase
MPRTGSPHRFRSNFVLNYGKPILVSQFKEAYLKDKAVAINELTKRIEEGLSEVVVHIASPEHDVLVAQAEEVLHNDKAGKSKSEKFRLTGKLVKQINVSGEQVVTLETKLSTYFSGLERSSINDETVKRFKENRIGLARVIFQTLLALVGLPFFIFGLVNNYIPYKAGYLLAKQIAKNIEFHASVHMYSSLILYLLFYPLQILAVALLFRNWYVLAAYAALLPLSGLFSLVYHEWFVQLAECWRIVIASKKEREELVSGRKAITDSLSLNFNL